MKKLIGKLMLKLLGWKVVLQGDVNVLNRCILVVAPHTHNMEYILGNFAYWSLNKPLKIIIKDAHTKAWYGGIVKGLGGIGIDRSQKNDLVNFVANQFAKEDFSLVITPEGTRSWVRNGGKDSTTWLWPQKFLLYWLPVISREKLYTWAILFLTKELHLFRLLKSCRKFRIIM